MKFVRNFKSLNSAKEATLYSPAVTKVTENKESVLLNKDLGFKDQKLKIVGSSLDNLEFKCLITGEWIYKSTNKDKILIKGEVTLNSKVDCYSIEFMDSTSHLTINANARLRIWQGGIVNNDCETINYFTLKSLASGDYNDRICGELLFNPDLTINTHPLASVEMYTIAAYHNNTYYWQHFGIPTNTTPTMSKNHDIGTWVSKWENSGWEQLTAWSQLNTPFKGYNLTNDYTGNDSIIYTFTGKINGNDLASFNLANGYAVVCNSYVGKMLTKNIINRCGEINIFHNLTNTYTTITSANYNQYKFLAPMCGFILSSSVIKTETFTYKELVWDPSFEEDEETIALSLLTTNASPLLSSSKNNSDLPSCQEINENSFNI